MGEETPTSGGDIKPDTNNNNNNQRNKKNNKFKNNKGHGSKKFTGLIPELGTFVTHDSRSAAATSFATTKKTIVGYASKSNSYAGKSIETGKLTIPKQPVEDEYMTEKDGTKTLNKLGEIRFSEDYKQFQKEKSLVQEHLQRLYYAVLGQCDDSVKAALKEDSSYAQISDTMDVLQLLKKIESLAFKGHTTADPIFSLTQVLREIFTVKQHDQDGITTYHEKFSDSKQAGDNICGGDDKILGAFNDILVGIIAGENDEKVSDLHSDVVKSYAKKGRDRLEAMMFILGADRKRYGDAVDQMRQDFLKGNESYPKDLTTAFQLLRAVNVKKPHKNPVPKNDLGHQFNTDGDEDDVDDGCPRCGRHHKGKCYAKYHKDGHLLHTMEETTVEPTYTDDDVNEDDDPGDFEHVF